MAPSETLPAVLREGLRPGSIVFAVPDFEPAVGGTARQVGVQARALVRRGYDVSVVTRRLQPEWPRHETIDGVSVHRLGLRGYGVVSEKLTIFAVALWAARRRRSIRAFQPVMWTDCVFAAAGARILDRTAVIWAIRGDAAIAMSPGPSATRRLHGLARRLVIQRCIQVVLTPSMARELDEVSLGGRTAVIPVPVDLSRFRPPAPAERDAARRRLGIAPAVFTAVFVGHLQQRKGVNRLIDAWSTLVGEVSPAPRLLIVGGSRGTSDDIEDHLREQAADARLNGQITFCGVLQQPRDALWAADAFVLPSFREGMPNSILEAMACGLPCVAPPSAGGDDLIAPETGLVPASNAPDDLLGALRTLAADPALRSRMGAAAVEHARLYDIERVVTDYERLYSEIGPRRRG
jgi:glycosyltransferase involved in cell wall biosynthesis